MTFTGRPYIKIDVSLITFLREKLMRWVFPGFSFILHLPHQVGIWFRYFCNLRLILRIPGACAQIAMSSANWEIFTCTSRGWQMSLTCRIYRIGERTALGDSMNGSDWVLFRSIEVNLKRSPSYQIWSKAFLTSRNIPANIVCYSFFQKFTEVGSKTERPLIRTKSSGLPALCSVITLAIFQLVCWMPKLMHRLKKKCKKFIRAGLRCLISLLSMQSKPGALLMSKLLIILSNSLILTNSSWSSMDFNGE